MTNKELLDKINVLYGDIDFSREDFKNELHAKITMFFLDNPDHKVVLSKGQYRRLHDGWPHTWSPWDWIADVMVKKKMNRYMKWVD